MKQQYVERKRVRRITIREQIEAQKQLAAELGVDEARWNSMTQKQLDEFWEPIRSRYTLAFVRGQGVKFIRNDSVNAAEGWTTKERPF